MTQPAMRAGEQELGNWKAAWIPDYIPKPGRLLLTNERIVFFSRGIGRSYGNVESWEIDLKSITDVNIGPRGGKGYKGALRRKLRIECGDRHELFIVRNLASVVATIQAATVLN